MVRRLVADGHEIVAFNRSPEPAIALSTERIMDAIKFFAKKYLARDQQAQQNDQVKWVEPGYQQE